MRQWYIRTSKEEQGPVSSHELKRMAETGVVLHDTYIRPSDSQQVVPAGSIKGLFPANKTKVTGSDEKDDHSTQRPSQVEPQSYKTEDGYPQRIFTRSTEMIQLHAELKKIQWRELPNAKIKLAQKALQSSTFPTHWKQRAQDLSIAIHQLESASQKGNEASSASAQSNQQPQRKQIQAECLQLADAILSSETLSQVPVIASDSARCRQLANRLEQLRSQARPILDKQAAEKTVSDLKEDLGSTKRAITRTARIQQIRRVQLPKTETQLGAALLSEGWGNDQTKELIEEISRVDEQLRKLSDLGNHLSQPDVTGVKAKLAKASEDAKHVVKTQMLQREKTSLLQQVGAIAKSDPELQRNFEQMSSTDENHPWLEAMSRCIEAETELASLDVEATEAPGLKIPTKAYVVAAASVGAALLLALFAMNSRREVLSSNIASREDGLEFEVVEFESPKYEPSQESDSLGDAPAKPNPPQDLPDSLSPLKEPNLRASTQLIQVDSTPLPDRPTAQRDFPTRFAGIIRGAFPAEKFIGIELDFTTDEMDSFDIQEIRGRDKERNLKARDYAKKRDGQYWAGYLVGRLPYSLSSFAKPIKGTVRVYRITDPSQLAYGQRTGEGPKQFVDAGKLSGWVDPYYRLVWLQFSGWEELKSPLVTRDLRNQTLAGFWLPEEERICGWAGNAWNHFFVSSNDQQADAIVQQSIAVRQPPSNEERIAISKFQGSLGPPHAPRPARKKLSVESKKVETWFSSLDLELSQGPYKKTFGGDVFFRAISLFATNQFASAFGKPVQSLTHFERERLIIMMREAFTRRPQRDKSKGYDYRDGMIISLVDCLSKQNYPKLMTFVDNYRSRTQWLENVLGQSRNVGDYDIAYQDLVALEPWFQLTMQGMLSVEAEAIVSSIDQLKVRTATARLEAWEEPITTLEQQNEFDSLLAAIDQSAAEKYRKKAVNLLRARLQKRLLEHYEQLAAIPDDESGIDAVGNWLISLARDFAPITDLECYRDAKQHAVSRHRRLVDAYAPLILYRINTAGSSEEVKAIQRTSVGVGYKDRPNDYAVIKRAVEERFDAIDLEGRRRFFSEQERQWMLAGTTRIQIPQEIPEPSAESIKIATYREMATVSGTQWNDPTEVAAGLPMITKGIGDLGFGISIGFKLVSLQKVMNPEGRTALPDNGRFRCFYRTRTQINLPSDLMDEIGPLGAFFESLRQINELGFSTQVDDFELTESGWRSATIQRRYREGVTKTLFEMAGQFGEGLGNAMSGWAVWPGKSRGGFIRRTRVGNQLFNQYIPRR